MADATGFKYAEFVPFANDVSKGTGLDFYTVLGWTSAEGGPEGNPLNLRPGYNYGDEHAAAQAVVKQLMQGSAEPGIRAAAAAHYPDEQSKIAAEAHAIAASPWNDPNGKGSASRQQYESNIDAGAATALYKKIKPGTTFVPSTTPGGTTGAQTNVGPDFGGGIIGGLTGFFGTLTSAETWIRVGLGAAGLAMLGLGLYTMFTGTSIGATARKVSPL